MKKIFVWLLLGGMAAFAEEPQLSTSQAIALQTISQKMQETQKQMENLTQALHSVEAEYAQQHPGYHIDEHTGAPAKDQAQVKPPAVKK